MWRGVSIRTLTLLLGGPLLMDLLAFCFLFWMNVAAVRMGIPPRTQMLVGVVFSLGYAVGAHVAGRWVTEKTAPRVVVVVALLVTLQGTAALATSSFTAYLVIAVLIGLTLGHYFMSFQLMMGHVRPFRTVAWTVAFYNISWGIGYTSGPLLSGYVGDRSPTYVAGIVWALVGVHSLLAWMARRAPRRADEQVHPHAVFESTPTMRLNGTLGVTAVLMVIAGLNATLWLALGAARQYSNVQIAMGVAAMALPVPALALLWASLRRFLRRPWLLIGSIILAAVAVAVLPLTRSLGGAMVCLSCIGVAGSATFFHGVFYVNADPLTRARSVSRYETAVGVAQMIGPAMMGLIAWTDATAWRTYGVAAVMMLIAAVAIAVLSLRDAPRTATG
jgi:MFS family permease